MASASVATAGTTDTRDLTEGNLPYDLRGCGPKRWGRQTPVLLYFSLLFSCHLGQNVGSGAEAHGQGLRESTSFLGVGQKKKRRGELRKQKIFYLENPREERICKNDPTWYFL